MKTIGVFRKWQKENPGWQLICDIQDVDTLYEGWSELPKAERMSWIGTYGREGKEAFEEFAIKRCKVPVKVLSDNLELHDILDWPQGEAMTVFKTNNQRI